MEVALRMASESNRERVAPVLAEVVALTNATHEPSEKLHLVTIGRWLRLLMDLSEDRWPDVMRIGREATAVVIGLVEAVDGHLDGLDARVMQGDVDWTLIRRHMLLASRRQRLVSLAVELEDLIQDLKQRAAS